MHDQFHFLFRHSPQCRDTFYIESFHVVILIYAAKRIHFGDRTYEMRVQLAVLDWVCWCKMGGGGNHNNKRIADFVKFILHYRMRMLAEKYTRCSFINTRGTLGEWPPLECCDRRPSSSGRPYGVHCTRGIKSLLVLCHSEQVCFSFTCLL